jgi:hypothetical protein
MKKLLLLSILSISIFTAKSQNADCKVLSDSLKGIYEGDCKNGKAEAKGKATGTDSYEGEFKNGLPDGKGKYTWKNGDFYDGQWKKGMKDGKGELRTIENSKNTVKTGYWKKDKYIGLYENPYKILTASSEIGRVEVRNNNKKGSSVNVTVSSLGSNISLANSASEAITMTDFQITGGGYVTKLVTKLSNGELTIFKGVSFPFVATFNFRSTVLQIEIFEEGDWDITVPILK